jgi:hypothetical protein
MKGVGWYMHGQKIHELFTVYTVLLNEFDVVGSSRSSFHFIYKWMKMRKPLAAAGCIRLPNGNGSSFFKLAAYMFA